MLKKHIKRISDKTLDKYFKNSILNTHFESLDFNKYFSRNIFKNLVKKSRSLYSGVMSPKTLRSKLMKFKFSKEFTRDPFTSLRFCAAVFLFAVTAIMITACGGGGATALVVNPPSGSGTDTVIITPTTYTAVTLCASGPALTSTVSQLVANALVPNACPAVSTVGIGVSIAGNMLSITGLPVGVTVASSTVTMASGASTVVFTNGVITSGALLSNALYNYTGATVAFTNAPAINIAGSVTSPVIPPVVVVCTAPAMLSSANACVSPPAASGYTWNAVVKVWVADRGVYVTSINTLPATCLNIGDACYTEKAADGTIKFQKGPNGVMFAYFRNSDGSLNTYPINESDGTPNNVATLLTAGADTSTWDYVVGTSSGAITKITSSGSCFLYSFTTTWGNSLVTCPVGP